MQFNAPASNAQPVLQICVVRGQYHVSVQSYVIFKILKFAKFKTLTMKNIALKSKPHISVSFKCTISKTREKSY